MENQKEPGGILKDNQDEKPGIINEIPEIKIFGKGEGGDDGNESRQITRSLFMAVVAIAVICIAVGIFKAWEAFRDFDETIMEEKDKQFYSLISSEDINIENALNSFCREADTFFARNRLEELRSEWEESGKKDSSGLRKYIQNNTMLANPVYADMLITDGEKIFLSASGNTGYSFRTEADGRGLRICSDEAGRYFMAYEAAGKGGIRYEAILSLEQLFINALGGSPARRVMLMDSTSALVISQHADKIEITSPADEHDEDTAKLISFMTDCQGSQESHGMSFELEAPDGHPYTARMIVQPSGRTTNGEFAIGIAADFDEALKPSRNAAEKILIYGGMGVAGVIVLLFVLLIMRRANTASANELEILRKKNNAMAELNQNMQALAHHQRLETIGTMTASIAHDFNNLLTPIMGYSMMAAEMLPDDQAEIQDYMMEVYNASVKAKDIVQRLADLSKKGKEESFKDLDPVEIIRSSLKVTLPAKPKNVEVRGRFSSGHAKIRGDQTQVSQLVINIVLNAYDAMREAGGTLTVSTRIEDGWVALRFKDTGTGMDAETLSRIFDPFYTTKESGKGTGLGLAIVHQICDTHGGKVYVDSEPGVGTEFRINFPMVEDDEDFRKGTTKVIRADEIRERLDQQTEY